MDYLVLTFYIYSLLGWFVEVAYVGFITEKKFYNRGFLNIPIIPIYGFGALLIILCVEPLQVNLFFKFIIIVFLTSGLEYITSLIMEYLFHTKWWDYSNYKYNLNGRICMRNSLLFGVGGLIIVQTYAAINGVITQIDLELVRTINSILLLITVIDLHFVLKKLVKLDIRDIHLFAGSKKKPNIHLPYRYQAKIMSRNTFNRIFISNIIISSFIYFITSSIYIALNYFIAILFIIFLIFITFNYYKHKNKKIGEN